MNVEQNLEENNTPAAEAAPARRRTSRRVTAAAGAAGDVVVSTTESAPAQADAAAEGAESPKAAATEASQEAPKEAPKRATRSRKKVETPADADGAQADAGAADVSAADTPAAEASAADAPASEAPKKRATRSRKSAASNDADPQAAGDAAEGAAAENDEAKTDSKRAGVKSAGARGAGSKTSTRNASGKSASASSADADADAQTDADSDASSKQGDAEAGSDASDNESAAPRRSRRRANSAADTADGDESNSQKSRGRGRGKQENAKNDSSDQESADGENADSGDSADKSDKNDKSENGNRQESGSRSSRTRQRDRKRRGGSDDEPEITEDDVLLPIAGILDVLDNYAFVRTSGYLPGVSDVYVALGQVKKYSLRRGDAIVGAIRQPRENDGGGRQKYNAIVKIDSVNGKPVEDSEKRPDIAEMTAIFPEQSLRFGAEQAKGLGAQIDAHAPMGLGQRALVALPAHVPAARLLSELATAVTANAPTTHLQLVLTNARPEEVTHLQRTVSGEVIAASFDRPAEDQTTIVELALDRACRLVELGHDVVVLLDSLSDLAQAYVQGLQGSRISAEQAEAQAIAQVKRLLASARNVENGGSLTLVAATRVKGSDFEKRLLREITPAANSFVRVSGSRVQPEIDDEKSYTISL